MYLQIADQQAIQVVGTAIVECSHHTTQLTAAQRLLSGAGGSTAYASRESGRLLSNMMHAQVLDACSESGQLHTLAHPSQISRTWTAPGLRGMITL